MLFIKVDTAEKFVGEQSAKKKKKIHITTFLKEGRNLHFIIIHVQLLKFASNNEELNEPCNCYQTVQVSES